MTQDWLFSIATTGFLVAVMHAAIPTHWLPVVLAARAQRWTPSKALGVTALVGGGHVLLTALLGFVIVWLGSALNLKVGVALPWIATIPLMLLGLWYVYRQLTGRSHGHLIGGHRNSACHHDHNHCHSHGPSHGHGHSHVHGHGPHAKQAAVMTVNLEREMQDLSHLRQPAHTSDWVAIGSLFALLTFSPCESFLPVYMAGIQHGWLGFAVLSGVLAVATLTGMIVFTGLALFGVKQIKMPFLEKYENGFVGVLLLLLGVLNLAHEHFHH